MQPGVKYHISLKVCPQPNYSPFNSLMLTVVNYKYKYIALGMKRNASDKYSVIENLSKYGI